MKIENGGSCFDEWDQTLSYMLKLDALGCMADGVWSLPKGAVVSALHVVTRPSDMRRFKRDGTPYAVRTVLDLTKSQVNAAQKRWRFRLEGADGAVRLIGETGHKYLGACDISKYFPSIGLHPRAQQFCWIKRPTCSNHVGRDAASQRASLAQVPGGAQGFRRAHPAVPALHGHAPRARSRTCVCLLARS